MDSYSKTSSFIDLLNIQQQNPQPSLDFSVSNVSGLGPHWAEDATLEGHTVEDRKERRKWTPTEDVVLISAWLNTSKDPVVGNEQKAIAFWKRIAAYVAASPKLAGMSKREPTHCKQRDATGRFGHSPLQKATAAIRMMAYGCPADAVDEYLRLGTLNDINILDRSPVFDDILQGRAPKVNYIDNGHEYHLAYYLTDGIYPKWATFVQSIPLPQGPKASLFATNQEAVRKDVERAFGVLQARFAIVKNQALL
uniref:Myb-like domain-containing protein n=1 Tax=Brassica oleracea var. oleracea TaxID=109376 RepID=A0A0D3DJN9_BRAOL